MKELFGIFVRRRCFIGNILKKYSVRLTCAVLCWAMIIVPCFCILKQGFKTTGVGVSGSAVKGQLPSAIVMNLGAIDEDFETNTVSPSLGTEDIFSSSDKVISSLNPGFGGSSVQAPTKPSAPIVQAPPVSEPDKNTDTSNKNERPVTDGNAQLFDTYALLPQPDGTAFRYYEQTWPVYTNYPYGYNTVGGYGCGPTSMAMVISNLTSHTVSPTYMADWSFNNGYYFRGRGTAYGLFPAASAAYGIKCSTISVYDKNAVVSALKAGKLLLTVVGYGDFTRGRHFLLIRGITDDGKLLLADSGKYENCLVEWDYNKVIGQVANSYFWVFEN
ncbi:MAG: C39 family peptidase [Clostridia bacterium]|nr:C39 family peptidase [Clostridia bacterium]